MVFRAFCFVRLGGRGNIFCINTHLVIIKLCADFVLERKKFKLLGEKCVYSMLNSFTGL